MYNNTDDDFFVTIIENPDMVDLEVFMTTADIL